MNHTTKIITLAAATLAAACLAPAQQAPRTAAQQYKNIQVLKDAPATEFIQSMRFLSTALGVECEFCHQGTRSVDTPNKIKARQMMTMMAKINADNFGGAQVVTCNTCHNGNHVPMNAPKPTGQYSTEGPQVFYKPTAPPVGATDDVMYEAYKEHTEAEAKARAAATPTVDQILAKYVTALGGETAIRKVTSRVVTATVEAAPNVRGAGPMVFTQQVQYSKAPSVMATAIQGFGGAPTARGYDGTEAWQQAANGNVTAVAGVDGARAKRDADFYRALNLKQEYTRLTLTGSDKVDSRDVWVVNGVVAGDNPDTLYFDKESGLLLRKGSYNTTPLGKYVIHTNYEDYRDVAGVKLPFLIRTISVSPADTLVVRVEKVESNATIDAAKLAKPAPRQPAAR